MNEKVHKITQRGIMPDGTKVQVEDWEGVYTFEGFEPYTLAAYAPIVNLAALDKFGRYLWQNDDRMRLSFNFSSMNECMQAFDALTTGRATLQDYVEHAGAQDKQKNYLWACGLEWREAASCA